MLIKRIEHELMRVIVEDEVLGRNAVEMREGQTRETAFMGKAKVHAPMTS